MAKFTVTPPAPSAGKMSNRTKSFRPAQDLTDDERAYARSLRVDRKMSFPDIALAIGKDQAAVEKALSNIRLPAVNPSRRTINITREDAAFIEKRLLPGEPFWQGVHRILETHVP